MKPEIMWKYESTSDFLNDLKSFASSVDWYQIVINVETSNDKYVYLDNGDYEITSEKNEGAFRCPNCSETVFDVMEGEFLGNAALGLACLKCETYGAVFPNGM